MEIIKLIYLQLEILKKKYQEIRGLSSWKNFRPRSDQEAINRVLHQRAGMLAQIGEICGSLRPLQAQLNQLPVAEVVREIVQQKYNELHTLTAEIREADQKLMGRIERCMREIQEELTGLNMREQAINCYAKQASLSY